MHSSPSRLELKQCSVQINVPFEKDPLIRAFDAISDDHEDYPIFFPLFWLEEGAYLDDKNADLLKDLVSGKKLRFFSFFCDGKIAYFMKC